MWEIYGNTKDDIWELCRENVDFSHILPTYSLVLHKEWSTRNRVHSFWYYASILHSSKCSISIAELKN